MAPSKPKISSPFGGKKKEQQGEQSAAAAATANPTPAVSASAGVEAQPAPAAPAAAAPAAPSTASATATAAATGGGATAAPTSEPAGAEATSAAAGSAAGAAETATAAPAAAPAAPAAAEGSPAEAPVANAPEAASTEPIRYVSGGTAIAPAAVVEALQLDEEGRPAVEWSEEAAAALEHALASAGDDAANWVAESEGQMMPLLHIALKSEDLERVRTLLELGARPEELDFDEDDDGSEGCALHLAAAQMVSGKPEFNGEAVRLLLCAMLDPETRELRVPLDALLDGEGKTPLAVAAGRFKNSSFLQPPSAERDVEEDAATAVVRLLLSCGSSAAAVATPSGESVLHIAAEWAPAQCVSLLLESPTATAEALATADASGAVPLQRALALGRGARAPADSVQLLLRRQAALVAPAAPGGAPPPDAPSAALHRFLRDAAAHKARDAAGAARRVDYAGCVQQQLDAGARPDHAAASCARRWRWRGGCRCRPRWCARSSRRRRRSTPSTPTGGAR